MEVFRLARKKHGANLSPTGAAIRGGRWNSRGTEIIYTAESRALAMAEVAVYLSIDTLPDDYMMLTIEVPGEVECISLSLDSLPAHWNAFPHLRGTQKLRDAFIHKGEACILRVPSAVVPGDHNLLINPYHPNFRKIAITDQQDFPFDKRLF